MLSLIAISLLLRDELVEDSREESAEWSIFVTAETRAPGPSNELRSSSSSPSLQTGARVTNTRHFNAL